MPVTVSCQMVEFHRFGRPQRTLSPDTRYIRTTGWDAVAQEVSPTLDHEELLRSLNALRYEGIASGNDIRSAQGRLGDEATRFLDPVSPPAGDLLQVDLVTNAAELWAFPFEACFARHPDWLEHGDSGVVVTRRIRGGFADTATAWPVMPRVLFVHAPVAPDLEGSLVEEHTQALVDALAPWAKGTGVVGTDLLEVREVASLHELARCRDDWTPTYVHLLAHGAPAPRDPLLPQREIWGLRLGFPGEPGVPPAEVAAALQPREGLPLVVTLAACDSANQSSPAFAVQSVAQELHRCGIAVVIGSQLPLTKPGSSVLARTFYDRLLRGDDVRLAFHASRVALRHASDAGHDWLSLVGYVRLPPEGYAEHLEEVGLRRELRLLDAAQAHADRLSAEGGQPGDFAAVEARLRSRLQSLGSRRARLGRRTDLLDECRGLEASAYKRLAELQFVRGRQQHGDDRTADWEASHQALTDALAAYRTAYEANLHSHWLGVQQLSLEVVLTGRLRRPDDWLLVARAAAIARDAPAAPGQEDYWSCGSLTELGLLAPRAGRSRDLDTAKEAAGLLVTRARARGDDFAIASTRRQIARYVHWWTAANGFFAGTADLSHDAAELLQVLA